MKILIVEDDPGLAKLLKKALGEAGYSVRASGDGVDAFSFLQSETFDLILLDVMLPGMDGFTICRKARTAKIATPILLLTARDAVSDKVEGLDAGADDYLVKPFQVAELLARVRALLRRGAASPAAILAVSDLTLDPATREARRGEREIRLSATEYALLEYLMRNSGRVLTRSLILEHVWQYDFGGSDNVLDVYIGYLRNKIDKGFSNPLIRTVRGVGFMIESPK
jgi:DNA-binding response OmpR family regulator